MLVKTAKTETFYNSIAILLLQSASIFGMEYTSVVLHLQTF